MFTDDDFDNLIRPIISPETLTLEELFASIANLLVFVAGILAFFYLVYVGILYITAANNPDQAKKAQQGLINVIIGIIVITLSYAIVRTVGSIITTVVK